jgi:hypothetical protein
MKAREISEVVTNLPEVAKSPAGAWYETSAAKVKSWFKQMSGSTPNLDTDDSVRHFVFVPVNHKLWSLDNKVLQFSKGELGSVGTTGGFYTGAEAAALQALVDAIRAKNGERIWGDYILYQGQVYPEHEFLATLPKVGEISTGVIHEVPADARWCLQKLQLKYLVNSDRVVVFKNTTQDVSLPWSAVSIKYGKMSDIQSQRKLDKVTQVKLGKEVSQALDLKQNVTVNTHIIPESKLHKTLRAIHDHPGVTRFDLYWRVLNLKKLPPYQSAQDVASELVKLGLVTLAESATPFYTQDTDKHYTITTIGKLVLARVNAGKPVAKTSVIKQ